MWASVVVMHGLSSCDTWVELLHGMWDLLSPGIKPMYPALAGELFTTEPPEKLSLSVNGTGPGDVRGGVGEQMNE